MKTTGDFPVLLDGRYEVLVPKGQKLVVVWPNEHREVYPPGRHYIEHVTAGVCMETILDMEKTNAKSSLS